MTDDPTIAKKAAPPTIRLDVHAHVIPLRKRDVEALPGIAWTETGFLVVDGTEMPTRQLYDARKLIDWMDAHRVEKAWISIPPTLYRHTLAEHAALQWAEAINIGLTTVAASFSDRLMPLFHLPMQHPGVAAGVAAAASASGQARFAMPAGSAAHGLTFSDADYEPLWAVLNRAHAFLFLHPSRGCDPRLDRFHLHNLVGGPTETAIAAAHLVMSGVLDRHPGITVCLAHGGGVTAAVAGRLERGRSTGRSGPDTAGANVTQALRRFYVDCITHDAAALQLVAATHGADRVLFGSDWPFVMGLPDPARQLADVDPHLLQRLCVDNPERLLSDIPATLQSQPERRNE
jgi:aminocarboxymuconate-semialdehyde decarboxylase